MGSIEENRHFSFLLVGFTISLLFLAAGTSAVAQDSLIISAQNVSGIKYTAPVDGLYRFTIIGGSYSRWPHDDIENGTYWNNCIHIFYNRPIEWVFYPDRPDYGPDAFDYYLGDGLNYPTAGEAEQAGIGLTVDIPMKSEEYIILICPGNLSQYLNHRGQMIVSAKLNLNALVNATRAYQEPLDTAVNRLIVRKVKSIRTKLQACPANYETSYIARFSSPRSFKNSLLNLRPEVMLVHSHGGCCESNSSYLCFMNNKCVLDADISALNFTVDGGLFFAASCNSADTDNLGLSIIAHGYHAFIGYKKTVFTDRSAVFYKRFFDKALKPDVTVFQALKSAQNWAMNQNDPPWEDVASARIIPENAGHDIYLGGKTTSLSADDEETELEGMVWPSARGTNGKNNKELFINETKMIDIASHLAEIRHLKAKYGANLAIRMEEFSTFHRVIYTDKRNGVCMYGVDFDKVTGQIVSQGDLN